MHSSVCPKHSFHNCPAFFKGPNHRHYRPFHHAKNVFSIRCHLASGVPRTLFIRPEPFFSKTPFHCIFQTSLILDSHGLEGRSPDPGGGWALPFNQPHLQRNKSPPSAKRSFCQKKKTTFFFAETCLGEISPRLFSGALLRLCVLCCVVFVVKQGAQLAQGSRPSTGSTAGCRHLQMGGHHFLCHTEARVPPDRLHHILLLIPLEIETKTRLTQKIENYPFCSHTVRKCEPHVDRSRRTPDRIHVNDLQVELLRSDAQRFYCARR